MAQNVTFSSNFKKIIKGKLYFVTYFIVEARQRKRLVLKKLKEGIKCCEWIDSSRTLPAFLDQSENTKKLTDRETGPICINQYLSFPYSAVSCLRKFTLIFHFVSYRNVKTICILKKRNFSKSYSVIFLNNVIKLILVGKRN